SLFLSFFFFKRYGSHRDLHSFPTRRSSDLRAFEFALGDVFVGRRSNFFLSFAIASMALYRVANSLFFLYPPDTFSIKRKGSSLLDRKSTRLNSSHVAISYAVFCLKKKKQCT